MFKTLKDLKKDDTDRKEDKKEIVEPVQEPTKKGEPKFPPLPNGLSSNRPH